MDIIGSLWGLIGTIFVLALCAIPVLIYFLPAIWAYKENKKNREAILILNFFLGWTLIGWVVALIWAATHEEKNN